MWPCIREAAGSLARSHAVRLDMDGSLNQPAHARVHTNIISLSLGLSFSLSLSYTSAIDTRLLRQQRRSKRTSDERERERGRWVYSWLEQRESIHAFRDEALGSECSVCVCMCVCRRVAADRASASISPSFSLSRVYMCVSVVSLSVHPRLLTSRTRALSLSSLSLAFFLTFAIVVESETAAVWWCG